jgi:excinuclease ABC subunit B
MVISLRPGMKKSRDELIRKLVEIQYERNDISFTRNKFRVRGDVVEVFRSIPTKTRSALSFLAMTSSVSVKFTP